MAKADSKKTLYYVIGGVVLLLVVLSVLNRGRSPMFGGGGFDERAAEEWGENLAERMMENAGGGDVDVDFESGSDSFSVKTKDGTFQGGNQVPTDWPSDAPGLYSGATVSFSGSSSDTSGSGSGLVFTSEAKAQDIMDFYKEELEDKGWKITTTANANGYLVLGAEKGEQTFSFSALTDDVGLTVVTLGISK